MNAETKTIVQSIDPQEIVRYSALADTWWDKSGPFWPLHQLNELRVRYLLDKLCELFDRDANTTSPLAGLRMLDVGCGGGILSEAMASFGAEVHGIDVVERNLAIARIHAAHTGLNIYYENITAEALAAKGVQYDVILNMEVVEHVAELRGFLAACNALVRPSGLHVIATLNRTLVSWIVAIIGAEYILRWLPRGTHQWRRFRKPQELITLLEDDGFTLTAKTGVRVNPFTRTMSLTGFTGVNYMLISQKRGVFGT